MKRFLATLLCVLLLAGCFAACAEDTWVCAACGKDAVGNFCPWCGAAKTTEDITCPECGKTWARDLGYAFCPGCGAALNGGAGEPPAAEDVPAEADAPADAPATAGPVSLQPEACVSLYREAVFGTAQMIADAVTLGGALGDGAMRERFRAVDFGNPRAAALIEVSTDQFQSLCTALQCSKDNLAKALNQKINSQFSAPYTQAAGQIAYSQRPSEALKLETENCVAAMLVYENDISLVLVAGDSEQGLFLLSAPSVLKGFGAAYVAQTLAALGLKDARCSVYADAAAMAPLRDADPESFNSADYFRSSFLTSMTSSEDAILLILPQLYACGFIEPKLIASETAEQYLYSQPHDTPEQLLALCKFISGPFDSAVEWLDPDGRKWHESHVINAGSTEWEGAPELTLPGDFTALADNPLQPGDKVLALYVNSEKEIRGQLPSSLQCGLPEACIPDTPGEADYYLAVQTHYEEAGVNNGITVYNAVSDILLYDAKTNAPVYYVDRQTDELEGFGNIATSDKFYVSVRFNRILQKINSKNVFG